MQPQPWLPVMGTVRMAGRTPSNYTALRIGICTTTRVVPVMPIFTETDMLRILAALLPAVKVAASLHPKVVRLAKPVVISKISLHLPKKNRNTTDF